MSLTGPVDVLQNIAAYVGQYEILLNAICFIIGALLTVQSLRLAARRSEVGPAAGSWAQPIMCFTAGIALLAFPVTTGVIVGTLFGSGKVSSPQSMFAYHGIDTNTQLMAGTYNAVTVIVRLIQFVGLIAIARGVLVLNSTASGKGGATIGSGITFLIAGGLAVNFPEFWKLVMRLFQTPP